MQSAGPPDNGPGSNGQRKQNLNVNATPYQGKTGGRRRGGNNRQLCDTQNGRTADDAQCTGLVDGDGDGGLLERKAPDVQAPNTGSFYGNEKSVSARLTGG